MALRISNKELRIEFHRNAVKDWYAPDSAIGDALGQLQSALTAQGYVLTYSGLGLGQIGGTDVEGGYGIFAKTTGKFSWEEVELYWGSKQQHAGEQGVAFAVKRGEYLGLQTLRIGTYKSEVTSSVNISVNEFPDMLRRAGLESILGT